MVDTPAKPDIEERYSSAVSATNLRVEADTRGSADMIIAAGWSRSRIGAGLLRLHTEWSAAEHPRRSTEVPKDLAEQWHIHEVKILLGKLKTLPEVRQQLGLQMLAWKYEHPEDKAAEVIMWWLDSVCPTCNGTTRGRNGLIAGCRPCRGTGQKPPPMGDIGKRLAGYMDECLASARISIGMRLRPSMKK